MRTMYDSVRPSAIPSNADMVAGYVDGIFKWRAEDWARFPSAVHVTISAIGAALAHVVDVEVGCVWPVENAVPWVLWARANGIDPTVYCNWQNDLHRVRAAFDAAGVAQPHYWVARYDGVREIPPGTVGKQHSAPEAPGSAQAQGHYDISSMADYWPGVDAPIPPPAPELEDDDVSIINQVIKAPERVEGSAPPFQSIALPPVGGSLSVPPGDGQAWLYLHVPNSSARVEVWASFVDFNTHQGSGQLLTTAALDPDDYWAISIPVGVAGLSFRHVEGTQDVSATVELFRG